MVLKIRKKDSMYKAYHLFFQEEHLGIILTNKELEHCILATKNFTSKVRNNTNQRWRKQSAKAVRTLIFCKCLLKKWIKRIKPMNLYFWHYWNHLNLSRRGRSIKSCEYFQKRQTDTSRSLSNFFFVFWFWRIVVVHLYFHFYQLYQSIYQSWKRILPVPKRIDNTHMFH